LAYAVARHKRGVYVYLRYVGRGDLVAELERNLRMLDTVIKFQTVKLADAVSSEHYTVSDEDVKYEHVEPSADEEEEEMSLARSLGLEGDLAGGGRGSDDDAEGETESDAEETS